MRVSPVGQPGVITQPSSPSSKSKGTFVRMLEASIEEVNRLQKEADEAIENLATGKIKDIAQVMIKAEKANITLQFLIQVRNKAIEAYHEIMRMTM